MVKLALILIMGAFAQGLAATSNQPPLLIQDTTAPLDAAR
jgi:hypothetical protein